MSFLKNLFGGQSHQEEKDQVSQNVETNNTEPQIVRGYPAPEAKEVFLDLTKGKSLDLSKNNFLNLSKSDLNLSNLRLAAGWDVNRNWGESDYDLDLCAYLFSGNRLVTTVFFNHMQAKGIYLDGDNLTGEGDGDDENIFINLNAVSSEVDTIVLGVVIYEAFNRNQHFGKVKNAYVRLVDENSNKEILRYNLSGDGNKQVAVEMAEIYKSHEGWSFKALGNLHGTGSIRTLGNEVAKRL